MLIVKDVGGTKFTLGSRMVEVSPVAYTATREQIRLAFKGLPIIDYKLTHRDGGTSKRFPAGVNLTTRFIQIGCKKFTGQNFLRLKRWALRRRK
jgi:hypothetical protein